MRWVRWASAEGRGTECAWGCLARPGAPRHGEPGRVLLPKRPYPVLGYSGNGDKPLWAQGCCWLLFSQQLSPYSWAVVPSQGLSLSVSLVPVYRLPPCSPGPPLQDSGHGTKMTAVVSQSKGEDEAVSLLPVSPVSGKLAS